MSKTQQTIVNAYLTIGFSIITLLISVSSFYHPTILATKPTPELITSYDSRIESVLQVQAWKENPIFLESSTHIEASKPKNQNEELTIDQMIEQVCESYSNVSTELVKAVIFEESRFDPNAVSYDKAHFGLMQLSKRWHGPRADQLGLSRDFFDPYTNIRVGVDYLSDLLTYYDKPLALMVYNMGDQTAIRLYNSGNTSYYARHILANEQRLKEGYECQG